MFTIRSRAVGFFRGSSIFWKGLLAAGAMFLGSTAFGQLVQPHGALGPINPVNGYPSYVEDFTGQRVNLPVPPIGDGVTAPTMIFAPVFPDNPQSVKTGFGDEAFFYSARSKPAQADGTLTLLTLAVEAAYNNGDPKEFDQFLFARIRVRFKPTEAGTYTVTHPWGVEFVEVGTTQVGQILNFTNDTGGSSAVPGGLPLPSTFDAVLLSPFRWRFMRATRLASSLRAEWLGDGVSDSEITPGENGVDYFEIKGPRGDTLVFSKLFAVSGHIPQTAGGAPEINVVEEATNRNLLDGNSVNFGTLNPGSKGSPQSLRIQNLGTGNLLITGITLDAGQRDDFALDFTNPGLTLAPGGETTVAVAFRPQATGARTAVLTILSNDADEGATRLSLTGRGNSAPLLTLRGSNPLTLEAGAAFSDPGVDVSDAEDPSIQATESSNTVLPGVPGDYQITWSATDSGGLSRAVTRAVRVRDTKAPVISRLPDLDLITSNPDGRVVSYPAAQITDVSSVAVVFSPPIGSRLPIGRNVVTITATDFYGNSSSEKFLVRLAPSPSLDFKNPAVTITSPDQLSAASAPNAVLKGTVQEGFGLESFTVLVNGVRVNTENAIDLNVRSTEFWQVAVALENGPNRIDVIAVDLAGRAGRATKIITQLTSRPDLAGAYEALLIPETSVTPSLSRMGFISVRVTGSATFSGRVIFAGASVPFSGFLRNDGTARFGSQTINQFELRPKGAAASFGRMKLKVDPATGLSGTLHASVSGLTIGSFAGKRAPYHQRNLVPSGFLNAPAGQVFTSGEYNVAFPMRRQTPDISHRLYPQGDGLAHLSLKNSGGLELKGYLADGTPFTAAASVREDDSAAIFAYLQSPRGALGGELKFADLSDSDVLVQDSFLWIRERKTAAAQYASGWPRGIRIDAVGTFYSSPGSLDFGQGPDDFARGNAQMEFQDGKLPRLVAHPLNVSRLTGAISKIPATDPSWTLRFTRSTGFFSGEFIRNGVRNAYRGMLINKGINRGGFGYFLTRGPGGEAGGVSLNPDGP